MGNDNKSGYKNTKVGWIPEEWKSGKFSDIAIVIMGQSPDGVSYNRNKDGVPLVNGPTEFTKRYPRKEQWTINPTKTCTLGDILLCVRGSSTGRINIADDTYCIGRGIASIREKESRSCSSFIEYTLSNIKRRILKLSSGSTFPNIDKKTLSHILIAIPTLPEQKKIAAILSTWDEAIELTLRLIDAKKQHRKALIQQLITGKKRLKEDNGDEWRIRTIGELVKPVSRPIPKPKDRYLSIGIRSHGKGTFHKIVNRPEKVMMDMLYCIEPRDLIVNITFAWEGAIAIATEEDGGGLVSHRFPTYRFKEKESDIDFFRYLMLTKRFIWNLGLISPGGAGRNRVLNQKDFLKLKVFIPGIKTQREIGKILSASDKEIILLEDYLNILEKQKRGLMQKLLTGEIRVKT